jgi:hypothetical protein
MTRHEFPDFGPPHASVYLFISEDLPIDDLDELGFLIVREIATTHDRTGDFTLKRIRTETGLTDDPLKKSFILFALYPALTIISGALWDIIASIAKEWLKKQLPDKSPTVTVDIYNPAGQIVSRVKKPVVTSMSKEKSQ